MTSAFEPAIAELQTKLQQQEAVVRETKQLINGLCRASGAPPIYPDADQQSSNISALRSDKFYGRPMATVIREILGMRQAANLGAASTRDIYDVMVRGGYLFETKNDANAMRGVQICLGKNPVFHRVPGGTWGLAEWYPKARAEKVENGDKANAPEATSIKPEKATETKEGV